MLNNSNNNISQDFFENDVILFENEKPMNQIKVKEDFFKLYENRRIQIDKI